MALTLTPHYSPTPEGYTDPIDEAEVLTGLTLRPHGKEHIKVIRDTYLSDLDGHPDRRVKVKALSRAVRYINEFAGTTEK